MLVKLQNNKILDGEESVKNNGDCCGKVTHHHHQTGKDRSQFLSRELVP